MSPRRSFWRFLAALPFAGLLGRARAQDVDSPTGGPGMEMLTIFLRHDETMTVDEINRRLKKNGWFDHFPPPDVEIASWYVLMGIGQVVTLRFRAEQLRDINRLVESEAWAPFPPSSTPPTITAPFTPSFSRT